MDDAVGPRSFAASVGVEPVDEESPGIVDRLAVDGSVFGVGVYRRPISQLSAVEERHTSELPSLFQLEQNYPNPFNPTTTIRYSITKSQRVTLTVFDVLGKEVETLVDGEREAGTFKITWDATNYPSGVYFYRLSVRTPSGQTDGFVDTKKLVLLR